MITLRLDSAITNNKERTNGTRFSRREASASERSGRLEALVGRRSNLGLS